MWLRITNLGELLKSDEAPSDPADLNAAIIAFLNKLIVASLLHLIPINLARIPYVELMQGYLIPPLRDVYAIGA